MLKFTKQSSRPSDSTPKISGLFNIRSIQGKAIALTLEHAPCCLLSLTAGMIGVHGFEHNPAIELGFAVGGAFAGEYLGHKIFGCHHASTVRDTIKRYGISLTFGLATWGIHQELLHHPHEEHHYHVSNEAGHLTYIH